ncbi:MAG: hypothetical protein K2X75_00890 [Burkholderiaceae bacterium]|nr:hypothetical protein [Burkholderiaceae bacterium]
MKNRLKYKLSELGLYPYVDSWRQLPSIVRWIRQGCSGPAPGPIKRLVIAAYLKRYGVRRFVETGTYLGDTLAYMAHDKNVQCTSVELADEYYLKACDRFSSYSNVHLVRGDSGVVIPQIVESLQEPTLFWLDGHYSGAGTGRANADTPISTELVSVLGSPIKGHVILIDDARCFDGANSYPHLDMLLQIVRAQGGYEIEVSADIIRLTPHS